jgi:transposase
MFHGVTEAPQTGGQPMIYIGMDVHHKSTTFCIQDQKGKELLLESCPTNFDGLRESLGTWFAEYPGAVVGMESCSKAFLVSGIVADLGGAPRVFPADEVAKKTRSKKKKTDKRDAQDLCTNMRTGALVREVCLPPMPMRRLRSVLKGRQLQVKIQVQARNAAKAVLREYGLAMATGSLDTDSAWRKRLAQPMSRVAQQLLQTFFSTFQLAQIQINDLTKLALKLGEQNPSFDVVQTIPGVGPITRLALAAHLFDIQRFGSGKKVTAYVGLCPSSYDSGDRERRGRITREGPGLLRALLVECAQQASRRKNPLNPFYRRFVVKHGYKKAMVAIAAKLCRLVYGLVKRGESFSAEALGVKWDNEKGCYGLDSKRQKAA